jgi:hypothetical protein
MDYTRKEVEEAEYIVEPPWMNMISIRLSALFKGWSAVLISTIRDHTEVASLLKVEVRPLAETMEPASPKERLLRASVVRVSQKAVHPGIGTAIVAKPAGRLLRLSWVATPRNVE